MAIVLSGLNRVKDLASTEIDYGEVGTGTTLEQRDDTDLESPVVGTEKALTTTTTSKQFEKTYTLLPTEGNGNTITELGLKHQTPETLYSRITFTGFTKTLGDQFQFKTKWFIRERNK